MAKLDEIAQHRTPGEGARANESKQDAMVTTSLRLPTALLDQVRERAQAEDTTTTAWIRRVIVARLSGSAPSTTEARLRRLESVVFRRSA